MQLRAGLTGARAGAGGRAPCRALPAAAHASGSGAGVAPSLRRRGAAGAGDAALPADAPRRARSVAARGYGGYEQNTFSPSSQPPQFSSPAGSRPQSPQQQTGTALASQEGGTALKAKEQPKTVQVRFWLKFHVDYGQTIRIIGGHEAMGARRGGPQQQQPRARARARESRPLRRARASPHARRRAAAGAWNLAKAPFLRWSEGDLWNVALEVAAGGVYEYKYVVVEGDGVTAASWQRGANNVLALQLSDEEVEVYDNWKNAPGALVLVDGTEITRERKLLAWAGDMTLQRTELRRTRMELAQAREEIRVLRAELSVLRMEVSEANIARAAAEARQLELERANSSLRLEVTASQASARSTMEEAVRLLNNMDDDGGDGPDGGGGSSGSAYAAAPSSSGSHGSGGGGGGGGGGVFGSLFGGFGGASSRANARAPGDQDQGGGPGGAAGAVVAAAAAMAAAADARRHGDGGGEPGAAPGGSGTYSPNTSSGTRSYTPPSGANGVAGGSSEPVSANGVPKGQ
ncbi:hypothetical protein HT031_005314 [Scenedesmus sp. PABB004]|nr:hypothetical protein HT031_005314 [Scenedesmus sp. PABB004]